MDNASNKFMSLDSKQGINLCPWIPHEQIYSLGFHTRNKFILLDSTQGTNLCPRIPRKEQIYALVF